MLRAALIPLLIIEMVGPVRAPALVGLVGALNVLPGAFISALAGLYLDRSDKRRVLTITGVVGIITCLILAYLTCNGPGNVEIWQIMAITVITGFTNALDGVARNVIVKDALRDSTHHGLGGMMFTSLYTVAMILGSGMAGYLIIGIGFSMSFILSGLSYLVLIFGLWRMDFSHLSLDQKPWKGIWYTFKEGWSYTFHNRGLRVCIMLAAIITVFGFSYNMILSVIAKLMYHGGPREYSRLAMAGGFGSMLGSIITTKFSSRRPVGFTVCGCMVIGVSHLMFAFTSSLQVATILVFFCGFGFMTAFTPVRGAIMHLADRNKMGIVMGITFMFFYGGLSVSGLASGYLASHFGCPTVLVICGSLLIATGLVAPFLPGIKLVAHHEKK